MSPDIYKELISGIKDGTIVPYLGPGILSGCLLTSRNYKICELLPLVVARGFFNKNVIRRMKLWKR